MNPTAVNREVVALPLGKVFPNPDQPRKVFEDAPLRELAASIKKNGLLQPITVTPRGDGFMIIAGERRWRAHLLAEIQTIDCIVREAGDVEVDNLALIENLTREDINPIEEAFAFRRMLEGGTTREELAAILGYPRSHIWRIDQRLSLLNLTEPNRDLLVKGHISASEAYEMSRLDPSGQAQVLQKLKAGPLTYNALRAFVDGIIATTSQGVLLELQALTPEEAETVHGLDDALRQIERMLARTFEQKRLAHLGKASFHSGLTAARLDWLIASLQRVRKEVMRGEGVKAASES